jgi:hypothetical protein
MTQMPTIPTATGVSFDQAIGPLSAVAALPIDAAMPLTGWRAWLRWRPGPATEPMKPLAVWACVALGLALAISMLQWPYARSCGWWLFLYLTAVAMVIVAGAWSAWHAWDSRVGAAHVVAIAIVFWGCALTAREVLPRVGYARVSAVWMCSGRA